MVKPVPESLCGRKEGFDDSCTGTSLGGATWTDTGRCRQRCEPRLIDIYSHLASTYLLYEICHVACREKGGVVNQSVQLYEVQGLRDADASVMPTVPASNTTWTNMMFANILGRAVQDGRDVEDATLRS